MTEKRTSCVRCGKGKMPLCRKCMIDFERLFGISQLYFDITKAFWTKRKTEKEILKEIRSSAMFKLIEIDNLLENLDKDAETNTCKK